MDKAKLKLVVSTDPARNREINLQKLSDDDLMLRLKRNEYDAINELLDRYQPLVKGFITRYLGNSFLSSDITQEVFFYIWRERENYFPKNQFKSYLMKIVLNRCRYHSRQRNVAKGKIPQIENIYREKNDIATNPTDMWAAERAMYAQKILL
jgi:RNA polymerase sigma factor (sigma-70 family)